MCYLPNQTIFQVNRIRTKGDMTICGHNNEQKGNCQMIAKTIGKHQTKHVIDADFIKIENTNRPIQLLLLFRF